MPHVKLRLIYVDILRGGYPLLELLCNDYMTNSTEVTRGVDRVTVAP